MSCPACGSCDATPMGNLGLANWTRCRDCGWLYVSDDAEEGDDGDDWTTLDEPARA